MKSPKDKLEEETQFIKVIIIHKKKIINYRYLY